MKKTLKKTGQKNNQKIAKKKKKMEIRSLVIEYQSLAFKLIETLLLQAKKTPSSSGQLSSPQLSSKIEKFTFLILKFSK